MIILKVYNFKIKIVSSLLILMIFNNKFYQKIITIILIIQKII